MASSAYDWMGPNNAIGNYWKSALQPDSRAAGQLQAPVAAQAPDQAQLNALTQAQTIGNPRIEAQNRRQTWAQAATKTQPQARADAQAQSRTPSSPSANDWLSTLNPNSRAAYDRAYAGQPVTDIASKVPGAVSGSAPPPAQFNPLFGGSSGSESFLEDGPDAKTQPAPASIYGATTGAAADPRNWNAPGLSQEERDRRVNQNWRTVSPEDRLTFSRSGMQESRDERYAASRGMTAAELAAKRASGEEFDASKGVPSRNPGESDAAYEARFHAHSQDSTARYKTSEDLKKASNNGAWPGQPAQNAGEPTSEYNKRLAAWKKTEEAAGRGYGSWNKPTTPTTPATPGPPEPNLRPLTGYDHSWMNDWLPKQSDETYERMRANAQTDWTADEYAKIFGAGRQKAGTTTPSTPGTTTPTTPTTPGTGGVTGGTGTGTTNNTGTTTGGASGPVGGGTSGGSATAGSGSQSASGNSTAAGSTAAQDYLNSYRQNSNSVGSTAAMNVGDVSGNNNQFVNDSSWFKNNSGSIQNNWNFSASGTDTRGTGGDRGGGDRGMLPASGPMADTGVYGQNRPGGPAPGGGGAGSSNSGSGTSQSASGSSTNAPRPDEYEFADPRRPQSGGQPANLFR